jgi:hypothetical protein
MEFIALIILVGVIVLVITQLPSLKIGKKTPAVKKSEIIDGYKQTLQQLKTKEEKLVYLKVINKELSMNIFFDQEEIKSTISELSQEIV